MARVKGAMNARKKHKKVLKLAKGYRGSRSKLYRPANTFVMKALKNAYIGRKLKKRDFRKLWIQRINAAARMNGISYASRKFYTNKKEDNTYKSTNYKRVCNNAFKYFFDVDLRASKYLK